MNQPQHYLRFSIAQRIEHWVLVISFTILGVTGLPQRYVGQIWAETMIEAMGGIEFVRNVHRYAAGILLLLSIYHVIVVAYKVIVKQVEWSMWPRLNDAKNLWEMFAYNIGLNKIHPRMPRYNFEEKAEYWSLVWGTALMALTGFMLWNPIITTKLLPGSFIPAAKTAHSAEALLAVLAIIVWHMYGVHLRKFNKSIFIGMLSRQEMAHEHALELAQIDAGTIPPPPSQAEQRQRLRLFIPLATVITLIFGVSLYLFLTFEDTAPTEALAAMLDNQAESFQVAEGTVHSGLTSYQGPESCATEGCHSGELDNIMVAKHSQRIAATGPSPLVSRLFEKEKVENKEDQDGNVTLDCLICHAETYQPDDLLASARTIQVAGGQTCQRCHIDGHSADNVHAEVGLSCISCHTSQAHEISMETTCESCHNAMPHDNPLINSNHQRLDCRTCHERNDYRLFVDVSQAEQNVETGLYRPTVDTQTALPSYMWQSEPPKIVSVISVTVLAPTDFDPIAFSKTGQTGDSLQEQSYDLTLNGHNVFRDQAQQCDDCHGPDSQFDYLSLNLEASLSAVKEKEGE
ncbi:cytochrome b/b6 domain-containing protein [Anaerolineales bacterium HSG24]|nr:cytochrome b/b6 domain-containing protein [Anaerolineales bacterium HSG24]